MEVTIQQAVSSPPSRYEIETPACIYHATKKWLSLHGKVELFAPRDRLVATIVGKPVFFSASFNFELTDGREYQFWLEKNWRGVYLCEGGEEKFQLYRHKGLDYSIFQAEVQIAAFSKNKITIGAGDHYDLRLNDDANLVVILCMVLAIDVAESEGANSSVTYDMGNVGPEERPFDQKWVPG
jgi:uncharacterized protein YxjI